MGVISSPKKRTRNPRALIQAGIKAMSSLLDRHSLAQKAGLRFDGKRDYYNVFGYVDRLTVGHFLAKYARQDIASRVIDAPPEATWSSPPELVIPTQDDSNEPSEDSELGKKWKALVKKHNIWTVMERADRLSRLGRFSLIMIGAEGSTDSPLTKTNDLLFLRPLGESQTTIKEFITDTSDPKFGRPKVYEIKFSDPNLADSVSGAAQTISSFKDIKVHHSRMIHVVENPLEDDVFSTPIMAKVYNLLDDLMKIAGGTPETFWLTANRGLQADVDMDMEMDDDDAAALADEIEEYQHQLRRILRTRGVKMNVLSSETPSPKEVFSMLISLLSGTTGIPQRILIGSEAGQLASEQDRANWAERIVERRVLFAEPYMLDPLIRRFMEIGLLPEVEDYTYDWPEAFKESPLEQSQTMAAKARAVGNLSRQTGGKVPLQITSREEARDIVGLEGDLDEGEIQEIPEINPEPEPVPEGTPAATPGAPNGGSNRPPQQAS